MTERRTDTGETARTALGLNRAVDFIAVRMHDPIADHPYMFTLAVLIVSLLVFGLGLEVLKVFISL
ncbi:hypothetical protein MF271_06365 [Deinococcus sp. KNUC1210]|uniref:hypothetical protein n=1 Tax=Deinococcus sp. KNUC1210 TaxID=2917691 RepID=UPI001EF03DFE|nr:hypothetical protein [Deinococcus sp. KNUC1210]ULH16229.1 hypothetical protein MF271_06365 [Deinococcus sp. KNUC1210]